MTLGELQSWIGREVVFDGVDGISVADIRRKLEVYCFDCPLHLDDEVARAHGYRGIVAPVTMTHFAAMPPYWSPGEPSPWRPGLREKEGGARFEITGPYPRGVNVASAWTYVTPTYPGDHLRAGWRLREVTPKRTKLGEGAFLVFETTFSNGRGDIVAVHENTSFRYVEAAATRPAPRADQTVSGDPGSAQKSAGIEDPDGAPEDSVMDWSEQRRFCDVHVGEELEPVSLWLSYQRIVMSVAADRMFSSIHHNRDAAREAGLENIIYNTLGYETLLEVTIRRFVGLAGKLLELGPYKMSNSSYPNDVVTCGGRVSSKERTGDRGQLTLAMWIDNQRGDAVRGQATVSLPL
jgi:acyl dehydratase